MFSYSVSGGESYVAGGRKGDALPAGTGHPFSLSRS